VQLLARFEAAHQRRLFARNRDQNLFYGVFDSAEAAVRAAPATRPIGYDNDESTTLYDFHLVRVFAYDYPVLYWFRRSLDDGWSQVLDIGGHIGIKYYAFRRYLDYPAGLHWQVCDVPSVAARGREVAASRDAQKRLSFVSTPSEARPSELLLLSGSLQYLPVSIGDLLGTLAGMPRRIIVNITPIHPKRSFFTLNSIGTAFCPYRVMSEADALAQFAARGYRPLDRWDCPGKPMKIPGYPEHSLEQYAGFCFDQVAQA
jgi:putative methyltransferase (TIGR04325 family)